MIPEFNSLSCSGCFLIQLIECCLGVIRASCRFSLFGGELGTFGGGEHSIEDHYLHINGIIFWGGVANFGWGDPPPPKKNRPPGNPGDDNQSLLCAWHCPFTFLMFPPRLKNSYLCHF